MLFTLSAASPEKNGMSPNSLLTGGNEETEFIWQSMNHKQSAPYLHPHFVNLIMIHRIWQGLHSSVKRGSRCTEALTRGSSDRVNPPWRKHLPSLNCRLLLFALSHLITSSLKNLLRSSILQRIRKFLTLNSPPGNPGIFHFLSVSSNVYPSLNILTSFLSPYGGLRERWFLRELCRLLWCSIRSFPSSLLCILKMWWMNESDRSWTESIDRIFY